MGESKAKMSGGIEMTGSAEFRGKVQDCEKMKSGSWKERLADLGEKEWRKWDNRIGGIRRAGLAESGEQDWRNWGEKERRNRESWIGGGSR